MFSFLREAVKIDLHKFEIAPQTYLHMKKCKWKHSICKTKNCGKDVLCSTVYEI